MNYDANLRDAMRKVEASRPLRLSRIPAFLSPAEKRELLERFHPNYIPEGMRALRVGPNAGDRTPNELALLLEGRNLVGTRNIDLEHSACECDVLVIGGGGAGASAALMAWEQGARVLLVTKLRLGDANTTMAQDGIQAATRPNDSPAAHYLDVVGGGGFSNAPELVNALVSDAPLVIQWLESLGCMFDKQADGTIRTVRGGGSSRQRMHSVLDLTGKEVMTILRDEVRNREIPVLELCPAIELVMDESGQVAGTVLQNLETKEFLVVVARTTILATGGAGRLHLQGFPTTNHYGATADGLILAYRAGAKLAFLDAMQYHPTSAAYPPQIVGLLLPDKVRLLGAQVVNGQGERFVHPLETSDVQAAAIIRECVGRKKGIIAPTGQPAVWLDLPLIDLMHGKGTISGQLPTLVRQFERWNIDTSREPVAVYPALHYQGGGIQIGPYGQTNLPNLYAAGEIAAGLHGHNRLVGNSLAEALVFGRRAGMHAAGSSGQARLGRLTLQHIVEYQDQLGGARGSEDLASPLLLPDYSSPTPPRGSAEGGSP